MSGYDVYDDIYNNRPKLKIAARLEHSGETREIARQAMAEGYDVSFKGGGMRLDMQIERPNERTLDLTVINAKRYFKVQ